MLFASFVCLVALWGPARTADPIAASRPDETATIGAYRQGIVLYRRGDYAEAAEQFIRVRETNPDLVRALAFLGSCYEHLNEPARARRCWQDVAAASGSSRLGVLAAVRLKALAGQLPTTQKTAVTRSALARVEPKRATARTQHFVVEAYNRELAFYVAERAERDLESIRKKVLGTSLYPHTVRIRIFPNATTYKTTVGAPHWSGGGFLVDARPDGTLRREVHLVQLGDDGHFNDRLLDVELPHELSHVVIDEFFGQRRCPVWLDEALAMTAERKPETSRAEVVQLALRFGTYAPLPKLLGRNDWPPDYPTSLLYAEAESVGRFLWARLGDAGGRDLLARLRSGDTVRAALERTFQAGPLPILEQLEADWIRSVTEASSKP